MLVFYTLIPSLSGMPKQYFFPIGFMVPTAVFSSLIIAYSVAPWTAKRILKVPDHKEEPSPDGRPKLGKLGHFYYRTAGGSSETRSEPKSSSRRSRSFSSSRS